jgi:PadR family transcriptional regulator, regulatory protein PadR
MAKKDDDFLKLSMWEQRLLALLRNSGELYGLQMIDALEDTYKRRIGFSIVYPTLQKLEDKGFVTSRPGEESDSGSGARRHYYRITGAGEHALYEEEFRYQALQNWQPI